MHIQGDKFLEEITLIDTEYSYDDLYGRQYGELYVIAEGPQLSNDYTWHCQCICGKYVIRRHSELLSAEKCHCGCKRYKKSAKPALLT